MSYKYNILKTGFLSIISLILGLVICEIVVRNFVTVRNVGPSFSTYDPFYGKTLKKNFSTLRITPEFTMQLTTNSMGWRGPEHEFSSNRPILFLGDSFTMGYGVNDGDDFPSLLRESINKQGQNIPVINMGIGNNGNGRWVKYLQAEGKKYNPGLVVLQIHENDFQNNIHERLYELTPSGDLIELPIRQESFKRTLQGVVENIPGLEYSYILGLFRQIGTLSRQRVIDDKNHKNNNLHAEQLLIRLLEETLLICKENKLPVLVVLADVQKERQIMLKEYLLERTIPMVIVPTKLERPELYYKVDGHWNTLGHKYTADKIVEGINKYQLKYW